MGFLRKNSLLILTVYAVCAAVVAALTWNDLLLTQKCAAVMVVVACLHEWEEQRFPGGFLELMAQNMGLSVTDEQRASMLAKPDLMVGVLTFLGFAVRDVPLFACAVILFGLLEGIVHVAGIKLMDLRRPYSPGLVTAELWAVARGAGRMPRPCSCPGARSQRFFIACHVTSPPPVENNTVPAFLHTVSGGPTPSWP